MKLLEAAEIKRKAAARDGVPYRYFLAMGATPLHLETYLTASIADAVRGQPIVCQTAPYGDLIAALAQASDVNADGIVVIVEYRDLDPRLGFRRDGGWTEEVRRDVLVEVRRRLDQMRNCLARIEGSRMVILLPTLPLPPLFNPPRAQSDRSELHLRRLVAEFGDAISQQENLIVVGQGELDKMAPLVMRHDVRSEIVADFPYTTGYAEKLSHLICRALIPTTPLKGLITDLDDTLWRGLVGEVGSENVSWSLEHRSHTHCLYQQLLESFSELGVLLAISSKNEPAIVQAALARADLRPKADRFFPIEIGWHAKSESVDRILKRWNIDADAVVFVDDSPLEVAEVKARHPDMHCYIYPREEAEFLNFIGELRDLFGKSRVSEEDKLRARSIRAAASVTDALAESGAASDDFLATLDAELRLDFAKSPIDPRALELINKTNQFNLNGRRIREGEWRSYLTQDESFLLVASYQDKFGPLGKIGVAFGRRATRTAMIEGWVLSCRAFSRRVEHAMLDAIFDYCSAEKIELDFIANKRNTPLQSFLSEIGVTGTFISRTAFAAMRPSFFHRSIIEV